MTTLQEWMSELLPSGANTRHRFGDRDRTGMQSRMAELFDQDPQSGLVSADVALGWGVGRYVLLPTTVKHMICYAFWRITLAQDETFSIHCQMNKASDGAGTGTELFLDFWTGWVTVATGGAGGSIESGATRRVAEVASVRDAAKPYVAAVGSADCSAAGTGVWGLILVPATDLIAVDASDPP